MPQRRSETPYSEAQADFGLLSVAVDERTRSERFRRAVNTFVARHQLAWDLSMAALALVFLALGYFEDHPAGALNETSLVPVELTITLLFVGAFALRCYAAEPRAAY